MHGGRLTRPEPATLTLTQDAAQQTLCWAGFERAAPDAAAPCWCIATYVWLAGSYPPQIAGCERTASKQAGAIIKEHLLC